ncbi:MAG TPA: hypothetical protein VFZ66_22785 [Herpetosiphonaceae bacterium]
MDIQQILKLQAEWTWSIMADSAQLGEMIREDAITSVNLATINRLAKDNQIPLSITSFQGAKLESEFGADWMWILNQSGYMVQAKRLDVVPSVGGLSYTILIDQLNLLVDASQTLSKQQGIDTIPAYVFYNSMMKNVQPQDMGCIFVNALVLKHYLVDTKGVGNQQSTTVSPQLIIDLGGKPWYRMFGG